MKGIHLYFYTVRIEAVNSLETLVNMDHTARCHVQDDSNYHSHRCENVRYDYITVSSPQKQEDNCKSSKHREDFYFADRFHGSALYGDRTVACCETHTNFVDESARMTIDNIRNEVVNNSQITGGVENAVPVHVDIFRN
jgi:hypothetical protein